MASTVHKLFMRSSPLLKPLMDTRTCDPIIWLTSSFHIELDGRVIKKTAYRLTISRPYNSANGKIVIVKTHLSRFIIIIKERAHSLDKHWFYFTLLKFCGQELNLKVAFWVLGMDEERMLSGVTFIKLWLSEGRTGLDPREEKGANLFGPPTSSW